MIRGVCRQPVDRRDRVHELSAEAGKTDCHDEILAIRKRKHRAQDEIE
jgi:hypothetical protein